MAKVYFAAVAPNIILGYAYVSGKILLGSLSSLQILVARFILATVTMYLISHKDKVPFIWKEEKYYALAAFFGNALSLWMNYVALNYTTTTNVGVLGALVPVITGLFGFLFLKEKALDRYFWIGCVLAMFGVILIYLNGAGFELHIIGDTICLLNGIVTSIYLVILGKISQFGHSVMATSRKITFYSLVIVVIAYLATERGGDWSALSNGVVIANLLLLGVGASGICLVGYSYATRMLGVGKTGIFSYFCVIMTVVYSALILHDKLTWHILVATGLILIGTLLSEQGKRIKNLSKRSTSEHLPD